MKNDKQTSFELLAEQLAPEAFQQFTGGRTGAVGIAPLPNDLVTASSGNESYDGSAPTED